jgi:arylsulfatase A
MGNRKGVKTNMKKDKNAFWEIYDLITNVNETTDVASRHPELEIKFEAILKKEHQPSHIIEWEFVDPKFRKE